jgi:DNA invertase Pin-like site-specific DNA recombinase
LRAAIYVRVSTDHAEQKLSPEHQLATCREYIEDIGLTTDNTLVYNDAGLSGTEMDKRMEVQRLVADARNGKFDIVVFTSISRFARDLSDALELKKRLESRYGIRIISVEEGYDSAVEGRNSEMIFTVHAMVAAHKSQEMSKAIRRGLRQSAASGRHIGNKVPYGYQKTQDKRLIPDPTRAPVVQEIFNLYLSGLGSKAIAGVLNQRGIPPQQAEKWQAQTINAILHNQVYRGNMIANKWRNDTDIELSRQQDAKVVRQMQRAEDEWVLRVDNHEAIIDAETFDVVQNMLNLKARNKGIQRNANVLSGLMRCADCGGAAIVRSGKKAKNGQAYKYVGCSAKSRIGIDACTNQASISYDEVLNTVLEPLQSVSNDPASLDRLINMILQSIEGRNINGNIMVLQRQLDRCEHRQKEALKAYTDGLFSADQVKEHMQELKEEAKKLQDDIGRLEAQMAGRSDLANLRNMLKGVLIVFQNINKYDSVLVHLAFETVLEKIEISGDKHIKVSWKWDTNAVSNLTTSLM